MPEARAFDIEMVIEKLNRHKSSGIYQILAELITANTKKFRSEILKLINSIWNKEELGAGIA